MTSISNAPEQPRFSLEASLVARDRGAFPQWLDAFLRGPGSNIPLADGLAKQQRWWLGPNELPLASLKLKCGPGLEFHEPEQDWTRRIEAIANEVRGGLVLPPLVAEYAAGKLLIADGNHRHGGLQLARTTHYWTAIWFNSKEDFGLYTSGR